MNRVTRGCTRSEGFLHFFPVHIVGKKWQESLRHTLKLVMGPWQLWAEATKKKKIDRGDKHVFDGTHKNACGLSQKYRVVPSRNTGILTRWNKHPSEWSVPSWRAFQRRQRHQESAKQSYLLVETFSYPHGKLHDATRAASQLPFLCWFGVPAHWKQLLEK